MPRDGAIIFRDLVGKLEVLNIECDKCGRRGLYRFDRLIERYGIDAKLFDWEPEADRSRKIARNEHDPCGARCPDCRAWCRPRRKALRCTGTTWFYGIWASLKVIFAETPSALPRFRHYGR